MLNQEIQGLNKNLLSVRNYQDIENIISITVKKCLNYFKSKTVIIDVKGMVSTLVNYESFQWQIVGQTIEFIEFPNELYFDIDLSKIIYIICETDTPDDLCNSVEFWLDGDNLVRIWTKE